MRHDQTQGAVMDLRGIWNRCSLLACVLLTACGDDGAGAPAPEVEAVDQAALKAQIARDAAILPALTQLHRLTLGLLTPGTVQAKAAPGENADAIALQVQQWKSKGCSGLTVTHVPGKADLTVLLPVAKCQVRGVDAAGVVDITVQQGGIVQLKLTQGKIATVATQAQWTVGANGTDIQLTELSAGTLAAQLTATMTTDGAGEVLTIDGTGQVQAKEDKFASMLEIVGVEQTFLGCYPRKGTVQVAMQAPLTSPKAQAGTPVDVAATVQLDADSPRDGTIDAKVQFGISKTNLTLQDITLPAYSDCPNGTAP